MSVTGCNGHRSGQIVVFPLCFKRYKRYKHLYKGNVIREQIGTQITYAPIGEARNARDARNATKSLRISTSACNEHLLRPLRCPVRWSPAEAAQQLRPSSLPNPASVMAVP